MFVTKQVFDPTLTGKAIFLKDAASEGFYLVGSVTDYQINLFAANGDLVAVSTEDFAKDNFRLEILEPNPPKPMRTTPGGQKGRKVYGKHNRTETEIKNDEQVVMNVLSTGKPVLLREIIAYRNNWLGGNEWTSKNASGFMAYMIRKGLPIEKVDYGRYRYKGGIE